jgi:hypothetical protein
MVKKKVTKKQKLAPKGINSKDGYLLPKSKFISKEHQVEVKVLSKEIKLSTSEGNWIWSRQTGALKYAETNATEIEQENAAGKRVDESGTEVDDVEEQIVENTFENTGD